MFKKVIQVALASLLVFFVAAPVIVGVYDASNTETSITRGNIEGYERDGGLYSIVSTGISKPDSSDDESFNASLHVEDVCNTLANWYSGDSSISDSLASGNASLIYEFSDGTTVDFGNPYVLDWSDVPPPEDYYEVLASVEAEQASIFAPEKAYAGPISWLSGKLKYLAIKSGYWKSLNSMIYSFFITVMMSTGATYTTSVSAWNAFQAQLPAITRTISSEAAVFTTEDTAMLVSNAISRVAARKVAVSEFPAALNTEIAANVTAVETTGMLLGGGSGNFVNALYQLAATGGVPASILYSDIGLYIGSWLGGQFDDYFDDVVGEKGQIEKAGTLDNGTEIYYIDNIFTSREHYFEDDPIRKVVCQPDNYVLAYYSPNYLDGSVYRVKWPESFDASYTYDITIDVGGGTNGRTSFVAVDAPGYTYGCSVENDFLKYGGSGVVGSNGDWLYPDQALFLNPRASYNIILNKNAIAQYSPASGWTGAFTPDMGASESQPFMGQIIGADAEFDADGNLINAGNVSVPDITAPGYIQPGSFSEALDQMQSTATIEEPAQSTSPTFGDTGTVGDWVNQNKPTTPDPSEESSQDDFKIEDLEKVFPFCIPWDLYYLLAIFTADPVAPNFNWHFNFAMAGEYDFYVDLSSFDAVAQVCRACETVLFCVGLALVTRNLIRG